MIDIYRPDVQSAADLRRLVDEATNMARGTYRQITRLIRLLAAAGGASSPDVLMADMLAVLSEVFAAEVTIVTRLAVPRLILTQACGLADDDPAWDTGWELDLVSAEMLGRAGTGVLGSDLPPVLAAHGAASAVWAPMSGEQGREVVVVCRADGRPFTLMDRQIVVSVTDRLRSALDVARYTAAMERLAQSSQRLVRHLDSRALLDEGVDQLRALSEADDSWLLTVGADGRPGRLHSGSAAVPVRRACDVLGPDCAGRGPDGAGRAADLPAGWWDNVERGVPYEHRIEDLHMLSLPVRRGDRVVAVLYAARLGRPFSQALTGIAAIFAGNLGAATENAELYRALGDSERSLRMITESISDMVALIDSAGMIRYASPSYRWGLGIEPDRLLGGSLPTWVHPDDVRSVRSAIEHTVRAQVAADVKVEYRISGNAGWVWVESAFRQLREEDTSAVVSTRVIEDRKELETELVRRATHDPLTGLANRTLIAQTLGDALARTELPSAVGLLFLDLDNFKTINDRLGHEQGDSLLSQVGRRLGTVLRRGDLLGRFGGDEFVVVLDGVSDLAEVAEIAQRAMRALERPVTLSGEQVRVSASAGGVLGIRGRSTMSAMLRDADAAMYAAKARGPGLVEVFDDDASHRSLDLLDLRFELAFALERDQLSVHYQPVCELASGRVVGFEALVRWNHPLRGWVPPGVFIPIAEDSGAIEQIGAWVLNEACGRLAEWKRRPGGAGLRMNVNISSVQLENRQLARELLATITAHDIAPADICLEVTEYNHVHAAATEAAAELHAAGVRFALDDFGTSYASLTRLKLFPLDTIKMDRSFVSGTVTDAVDRSVVVGVLAIGESLRLTVVAEGVETRVQQEALLKLGCRYAQGYLFSRPLTAEEAGALISGDRRVGV